MLTKMKSIYVIVIAVALFAASIGGAAAISTLRNIRNPEAALQPSDPIALVPPRLMPPDSEPYTLQPANRPITPPDGRPVAQLAAIPPGLEQAVQANFPQSTVPDANQIAYTVLSSIRYSGGGKTVLVTTARPSPAAAEQLTQYGNETINLPDGSTVWATRDMPGPLPNEIRWVKDGIIVTVASNLPIEDIKQLAAGVVLQRSRQ